MYNLISKFVLFAMFFMATQQTFGQLYEVPLDQRIEQSAFIVEGEVISSTCFRGADENIYTSHTVQTSRVLNGKQVQKTIEVITFGGIVDDEVQTWTHLLTLNIGDKGLFFLNPAQWENGFYRSGHDAFDVFASSQGFIKYVANESKAIIASEPFREYLDVEADLLNRIEQKTGFKAYQVDSESSSLFRSGIRFHFKNIQFDGLKVQFDLYANSLIGSKVLNSAGIQLSYNPAFFGSDIVANGGLLLSETGVSLDNGYDFLAADLSTNTAKISLEPNPALGDKVTLGVNEQLLGKGQFVIKNPLVDPKIVYDTEQSKALNTFVKEGKLTQFDTVVVEGSWRPSSGSASSVVITSVAPLIVAGGIEQEITITGSGFGTSPDGVLPPADKRVVFTPALESLPATFYWAALIRSKTQYVSWKPTEIKVRVISQGRDVNNPAYSGAIVNAAACSEYLAIMDLATPAPSFIMSPMPLYVKYSAINQAYEISGNEHVGKVKLANRNAMGGYDLYYSPTFTGLNSGNGVNAFERALATWRCNTLVNFRVINFLPVTPPINACKIDFGVLPPGVSSTTKASAILGAIDPCGSTVGSNFFYLTRFDMVFSSNTSWHTELSQPTLNWTTNFDLETIALHELGHAHLLWHTNNTANVMMPFAIKYKRALTPDDLEGGNYIVGYSSSTGTPPCSTYSRMIPLGIADCSKVDIHETHHSSELFSIRPNPTKGAFTIQHKSDLGSLNIDEVYIYSTAGHHLKTLYPSRNTSELQIDDLPSGVYILMLRAGDKSYIEKLTKH